MYSLVLMTAMSTTPSTPEFNGYFRDLFFGNCSGCSGYTAPRYSCSGGSNYPAGCSGSYYNGCNGCNGDTFFNRVRRWFDGNCCGGSGSGYGVGCNGSMAYSCFGSSQAVYSCFGGPAVSYTPVVNGGQSCYGGPIPFAPPPVFEPYPTTPLQPGPPSSIPYAPPEVAPATNLNTGLKPAGFTGSALVSNSSQPTARATVIVKLPADARLFADARPLSLTGAERKFVTPELPTGQSFTYRFRIEYDRDGEIVSVTKRVPVQPGGTVTIEFADLTAKGVPDKNAPRNSSGGTAVAATPTANSSDKPVAKPEQPVPPAASAPSSPAGAATDRATITVKLPAGATLYVDDRKSPSNEPVRQFRTPPIPTGRDFAYLLKAEISRNGQTETFTQKVPFRAGERVEVDFTATGR
jgi:uncharacterized protein (TIGR03000 family)